MKRKLYYCLSLFALLGTAGWGSSNPPDASTWINQETHIINAQASNIDTDVLKLGLKAFVKARQAGYDAKGLLTIIDYSKISTERRLWVIDLKSGKVLVNTWVTHGKNSGILKPTSFSNQMGTLKSSYGVFVTTGVPYTGMNGYSLRLKGLEQGINDNAYKRALVVHGAWYANPSVIKKYGMLGRSWGCPAVDDKLAKSLIDTIKENTLVFMYAPEYRWLHTSPFLVG